MTREEIILAMLKIWREAKKIKWVGEYSQQRDATKAQMHELYLRYLQLYVMISTNYPKFILNAHELQKYENVNCYMYALNVECPIAFLRILRTTNIGFISDTENTDDLNDEERLYKDLEILGIKYFETTPTAANSHNGYKIAYFTSPADFHFRRQNIDGLWSEKSYAGGPIKSYPEFDTQLPRKYKLVRTLEIVKPVLPR